MWEGQPYISPEVNPPKIGAATPEEAAIGLLRFWSGQPIHALTFCMEPSSRLDLPIGDGGEFSAPFDFPYSVSIPSMKTRVVERFAFEPEKEYLLLAAAFRLEGGHPLFDARSMSLEFLARRGPDDRWFVVVPNVEKSARALARYLDG
jgi:hypothetical protein